MKHYALILTCFAVLLGSLCACNKWPYEGDDFDNVMIFYGGGYNNLAAPIKTNIDELCQGAIPEFKSHNAILVFSHTTKTYSDYTTPNSPVLIRIYRDKKGIPVRDTVMVYSSETYSIDEQTVSSVLNKVRTDYPAKHYGLVFSSHSTGWIPPGYTSSANERTLAGRANAEPGIPERKLPAGVYPNLPHDSNFPETKSIGAQYYGDGNSSYQMELNAFAQAIPMKLDYIVFDSCLMGGIEVAHALKDVCSRIVFSPTEILKQGLIYKTMAGHLMKYPADLESICKEYFNYYNTVALTRAATISLIDCSKVDAVASDMASLIGKYQEEIAALNPSTVQPYFYKENNPKHWFYDMRDILVQAGAEGTDLARLDSDLASMVLYKAATPDFFGTVISPSKFSGLSMYLPNHYWGTLNEYYRTLSWNKSVNLVK